MLFAETYTGLQFFRGHSVVIIIIKVTAQQLSVDACASGRPTQRVIVCTVQIHKRERDDVEGLA